jgi:multidrug efflux pump subunit AcrA (membrane-fusion protein)
MPPGAGAGAGAGDGGGTPDVATLQAELARAQAALREANREAAERRKRLQSLEQAEQERKVAQLSEAEKAAAEAGRAKSLEAELRKVRAGYEVAKAASKVGVPEELAARLVDVEFDEAGQPVNVEARLTEMLARFPHLRPAAASNTANPGRKPGLTLADIDKMSASEVNARWDEVQAALKAGR